MSLAIRSVAVLLLAAIATAWLTPQDSSPSGHTLAHAVLTLVLAIALQPPPALHPQPQLRVPLLWSLLSGLTLVPAMLWLAPFQPDAARIALLTGGTGVLVFLFGCLGWSLAVALDDRRLASRTSLMTLALALTLPLWAAPAAVLNGANKWFVDAIVALSPASYLAALTDIDYLRSHWWYQHAPYGSLRFDYPDPVHATVLMLVLATVMYASARTQQAPRRVNPSPAVASALLEVKS